MFSESCPFASKDVINVFGDGGVSGGGGEDNSSLRHCRPNLKVTRVWSSGAIPDDDGNLLQCDVVDGKSSSQLKTRAFNNERTYVQAGLLNFARNRDGKGRRPGGRGEGDIRSPERETGKM